MKWDELTDEVITRIEIKRNIKLTRSKWRKPVRTVIKQAFKWFTLLSLKKIKHKL
jgi:hypothetical protein